MNRGWVKNYRKELKSDVWVMPPLYERVWHYLILSVNFEKKKVPMRDGSFVIVRPGQHLTSIRTMANAVGWYERGIWKEPNPKTMEDVLGWLQIQNMVTLEHGKGNKQFTLITIVNWDIYQGEHDSEEMPSKDEGNSEVEENKQLLGINNNDNNANNEKETKEEKKEIHVCLEGREEYSRAFENFWSTYPRRIEKKGAFRMWKARIKEKVGEEDMISAALNYAKYCRDREIEDRYIKHPATFLGKDKPYGEFVLCVPEKSKKEGMPRNVSSALKLYDRSQAGEFEEVKLW
jgi:uncharacterized protein YifE (UPF0438 family)